MFWWDGDAVAGDAQRCRRAAESINQRCPALRFHTLRPSRGRQADAACAQEVRESAAFACIVVVMAIPNTSLSLTGCLCACFLRRRSLARCLRGAAKCSNQHCNQFNASVRRLGSKWRTSATDEPRTRCESSYPDARRLSRFLPRLVYQRALEMTCILNCNSNNRQ